MIEFLREQHRANRTKVGRRRLRLFSCACVRRMWHLLEQAKNARTIIETVESFLDGQASRQEAQQLYDEAVRESAGIWGKGLPRFVGVAYGAVWAATCSYDPATMAAHADYMMTLALNEARKGRLPSEEEAPHQADLLRDIFGNPFRPLSKRKFPAEVRGLAQAYQGGDHAACAILADALADLGEEQASAHCREPLHVKGCHVVDAILGRQ
jgi:hypothetical protein